MSHQPFVPNLEILPTPQRQLWDELEQIPEHFTLYGGTAIALHLGHRESIDFDFFSSEAFDPERLIQTIPLLADAQLLQKEPNTLTVKVDRGGSVQLSFFGLPKIKPLGPMHIVEENRLKVASLLDLAGMKAAVVQQRAEIKDYLDIHAIIEHSQIDLPMALAAAKAIYGSQFEPQLTLKALSYFGDGDLNDLPEEVKNSIMKAVKQVSLSALPTVGE